MFFISIPLSLPLTSILNDNRFFSDDKSFRSLISHVCAMHNFVCLPFHAIINCHRICMVDAHTYDRLKWLCQSVLKIYQICNWWKMVQWCQQRIWQPKSRSHRPTQTHWHNETQRKLKKREKEHAHCVNYNIICIDCIKLTKGKLVLLFLFSTKIRLVARLNWIELVIRVDRWWFNHKLFKNHLLDHLCVMLWCTRWA